MSLFTHEYSVIPKRNRFHQPFESILSANYGEILPAGVFELDPGNTFIDQVEASIKVAPMKAPAFGRIDATMHFFFVPRRLLYDEFEKFITGGETGTFLPEAESDLKAVAPHFNFEDLASDGKLVDGSLSDYLGMPSVDDQGTYVGIPPIDAMPYAGYHKIFSDWYRDELLDPDEFTPLSSGNIASGTDLFNSLTAKRYRAWKKDYFTSARPDTQLGPEVGVPVTGQIVGSGDLRLTPRVGAGLIQVNRPVYLNALSVEQDVDTSRFNYSIGSSGDGGTTVTDGSSLSYVSGLSLDEAEILINNLRRSLKIQEWREKNMRGGNRYIENMYHHFGVKSSDARLQRSQYLGGRKIPVVIGEVLQSVDTRVTTEGTTTGNPLGQRAGVANAGGVSQRIKFFAEEHGFVYCLLSIMPKAAYFQGIPRMFANRWDPMEYAWPEFGNLGEQEIYNWELYVGEGSGAKNADVFGYQSRFADRKFRPNEIHGEFRSGQMMSWHTARDFSSRPVLNKNFVYFPSSDTAGGQNRIFVVENNSLASHFYCHLWHNLTIVQHLPKYGIPSI